MRQQLGEGLQDLADLAGLFWRRESLKQDQGDPSTSSRGWHGKSAWPDHSPKNQFGAWAVTLSQHRGHIWGDSVGF